MNNIKQFIEENKSILAVQSFLKWCFNFRAEDIDKLCEESVEFKHVWYEYILPASEPVGHVDYLLLVDIIFSKTSFSTTQKVLDIALERYEKEEANRLEFALDIKKKQEELMNKSD